MSNDILVKTFGPPRGIDGYPYSVAAGYIDIGDITILEFLEDCDGALLYAGEYKPLEREPWVRSPHLYVIFHNSNDAVRFKLML